MYYINCFFLFSALGHLLESFFYTNGESGILLGYWTPVYGLGTVIILFVYDFLAKKNNFDKVKGLIVFIICAIMLSIIEYIGGILIEKIFNITFWDYSNMKYNIGKYTSLEMAIIWGICAIILCYFIRPLLDKLIKKIPHFITWILMIIFLIDLVLTISIKSNLFS